MAAVLRQSAEHVFCLFNNCSRTEFEVIIVNACVFFYAQFFLAVFAFVRDHSDFLGYLFTLEFFVLCGLSCSHSEIKIVANIKSIVI